MIPKHLQGKSAEQIVGEMGHSLRGKGMIEKDYILHLEKFLLLAVQDALCNTVEVFYINDEDTYWSYADRANQAGQRAIEFLNMLLPEEK